MQNTKFLKMFAAGLAVTFVGALYAGYNEDAPYYTQYAQNEMPEYSAEAKNSGAAIHDTADKTKTEVGKFSLTKGDVDVSLSGKVTQKWMGYDKIYTLRAHNNDQQSYFLSKANVCLDATVGRQTFGESAADARVALLGRNFWNRDNAGNISAGDVDFNEAWINLHLGTFFKPFGNWFSLKDYPISVKMGWFPYELGRGISLGHGQTEAWYLGFDTAFDLNSHFRDIDRKDLCEPGFLVHGVINKDITYDFYYSKHEERGLGYLHPFGAPFDTRTNGVSKDRDLWAGRMDFSHERSWGNIHAQPYMMYMDESRPSAPGSTYFGSIRLGTAGLMLDYQKNKFCMNAEAAGQYGHLGAVDSTRARVDLRGIMGLVDAKYSFETVPMTIAVAAAHISGDKDPRVAANTATNIRHKGFVPYGDGNFCGKFVKSQIMLEARKLPRPLNYNSTIAVAVNDEETMHNLQYLGMGTKWMPFHDRKRLLLESNVLFFWEATTLKKWNRAATIMDSPGSESSVDASRHLGFEVNFETKYRPLSNCCLMAQLACFIPGQLYKDIEGTPNIIINTSYYTNQDILGLGHDHVWRAALMASFEF